MLRSFTAFRWPRCTCIPMRILQLGWLDWRITQEAENTHRRALGLPEATGASTVQRGPLEIQAYDEFCLPGPAAEWVEPGGRRPFVGALTLELPTAADDEVLSWIAAGPPPIYFGFGSMKVTIPTDTIAMISAACAQLGERALIWSGTNDFSHIPQADHVKIVDTVGQAAVFPACRAIVHHGGSGTTAAGLRAGIPTLILFAFWLDQPIWAVAVEQLKVGFGRRFSAATQESLAADLRLLPQPTLRHPSPRGRRSDDQTRRKPRQRRRSPGRRRPPGTLCLSSDEICGGRLWKSRRCGALRRRRRELLRRGHDVRLAVTVRLTCLRFIESAGLTAVPYGRDWQAQLRDEDFVRMIQNPLSAIHEAIEYVAQVATEKTATLMSLTNGADLLVAGINEQGLAANVAEYYGIPLAALHSFPPQILELRVAASGSEAG